VELFTWWDARGRRLPWLIALVLVLGCGYAAVANAQVAREAPEAHIAGVVPTSKVFLKAGRDAEEKCKADQLVSRGYWRCEGWWGGDCVRPWLLKPNYVSCRGVDFFMDRWDAKQSRTGSRTALYYAGENGTSSLRLKRVGWGGKKYGTSVWHFNVLPGGPQS
jgi:hypothetical protein